MEMAPTDDAGSWLPLLAVRAEEYEYLGAL